MLTGSLNAKKGCIRGKKQINYHCSFSRDKQGHLRTSGILPEHKRSHKDGLTNLSGHLFLRQAPRRFLTGSDCVLRTRCLDIVLPRKASNINICKLEIAEIRRPCKVVSCFSGNKQQGIKTRNRRSKGATREASDSLCFQLPHTRNH